MKRVWLTVTLFFSCFLCLTFGAERLSWDALGGGTISHRILFELRLPRCLLSLVVGGALAVMGAVYQVLFRNALAEPYVLGVSSASTLGIAIAELFFGVTAYSVVGVVTGFGAASLLTAALIVMSLSRWGNSTERIVLFGMGANFVLSSLLFLVLSYFSQHVGGGETLRRLFGQIPWLNLHEVLVLSALTLPFLLAILALGRHLDALALGDDVARTLGVSAAKSRPWLLGLSSGLLAVIVSYTGGIGFVGLVVPHAVRLVFRPRSTRELLVVAWVVGSSFLAVADTISRTLLPPLEFPIGLVTTLLGGPLFLYLLWRRP